MENVFVIILNDKLYHKVFPSAKAVYNEFEFWGELRTFQNHLLNNNPLKTKCTKGKIEIHSLTIQKRKARGKPFQPK